MALGRSLTNRHDSGIWPHATGPRELGRTPDVDERGRKELLVQFTEPSLTAAVDHGEPLGKLATATAVGTAVEYYDFYLYTSVAALIFGPLFFPELSTAAGTVAAVATVAAAFVARPVGAVIFGHFGDRFGRKATLIASMVVMGVATVLVGLVPGYAAIGIAAPLTLVVLRFLQGLAVAGAVLLAAEHAPEHRRGQYSSYPIIGVAAGFLLANGVLLALSSLLADAEFRAWGWRIPFLASVVLIMIGLYVRISVAETPIFRELAARQQISRVPVRELLRHQARVLLLAAGPAALGFTMLYLVTTYGMAYGSAQLHLPPTTMICLVMLCYGLVMAALPAIGAASDRWGRRRVCLTACVLAAAWAFPFVALVRTAEPILIGVAFIVALAIGIPQLVTMGAYLPELFSTRIRYTGTALSFNLASLLGAGLVPITATALSAGSRTPWGVAALVMVMAVIGLACLYFLPETHHRRLTEPPTGPRGEASAR
jgi:MFS family permease